MAEMALYCTSSSVCCIEHILAMPGTSMSMSSLMSRTIVNGFRQMLESARNSM